ncbi:MAG: hypothetical protein VX265_11865, partial [Myxococcota bacterium]|nr:hypothetical protein [Myxococcota bacterium]
PRTCRISEDGTTLLTRGKVEIQVWRPDAPGALVLRARAAPEQDAPTALLTAAGDGLLTVDESGNIRRWTFDAADLRELLWARSPSCGGMPDETGMDRFCACEACFGRHPAACEARSPDPLAALYALTDPGICPGS